MSLWGTGDPVIWIEGEQYDLPTPYKRHKGLWREEKAVWSNLERHLNQRFWGFRVAPELEWRHLNRPENATARETLIKLMNARECMLAPWGESAPRFRVIVDDHEDYHVEDYTEIDGLWVRLLSKRLYPQKIGPQQYYRASAVGGSRVNLN